MAHLYLRRLQASDATECGLDFGTAELNATCCDGLLDVPAPPISATAPPRAAAGQADRDQHQAHAPQA